MVKGFLKPAYDSIIARIGCPIAIFILAPLIRMLWIRRVEGLENIPADGACIVASNHESYLDFLCFTAVTTRRIHYLAAEKFFEHPIWKWVMLITGQIRVDRFADTKTGCLRSVLSALKTGKMIGIFPEGTRSSTGKLLKGKPGVAQLALKAKVPVIPVGIIGAYEVMSRNDRFPKLSRRITIRVGKPISLEELHDTKAAKESLQGVADHIMLKIAELTREEYPYAEREGKTPGFGLS